MVFTKDTVKLEEGFKKRMALLQMELVDLQVLLYYRCKY